MTNFVTWLSNVGLEYALWVKSIHIIFVISWMAGMLYLPRLFVYHTRVPDYSDQDILFKEMEQKLLKYIINPAMVVTYITGMWMGWSLYLFQPKWLSLKMFFVLLLTLFHVFLSKNVKKFLINKNKYSERQWRLFNEIPSLFMIIIVILVVIKPYN